MSYEAFLSQIREQLNNILTDDLKRYLDEEYDRFRNGNKISKAIISGRMIEAYKKAIEKVCYGSSGAQYNNKKDYASETSTEYDGEFEEGFDNESVSINSTGVFSDAFSGSEIRRTQIRDLAADLFYSVAVVFKLDKIDENDSDDFEVKNPIDKYDPQHESGRSLTEFIIICIDNNFRFAMNKKSDFEWNNKKSKVVIHTHTILKELVTTEKYDSKYADKMNKLKEMLTVDGTLRVYEKKAYNLSDDVLNVICDIIRLKYAEDNTKLDAVKLRRELYLDAIAEKTSKGGNTVPCAEDSDDGIEPEAPDLSTEEIYNNSLIWLMMDKLIEDEQKKESPSVKILSGKDVFFFHAIIEAGWGYSLIDRYPHLCERKVLDFVVEILKKGIKPTQKLLAKDYFNKTDAAVTKYYDEFLSSVRKNISRE